MAVEVPPPGAGVTTATWAVPAVGISAVEMAARSWVLLTKVVGWVAPFHCTTEAATKLPPVTVRVKSTPPAVALFGASELSAGVGLTVGAGGSLVPAKASRPIVFPPSSANQRLRSGPAVMLSGALPLVGTANSVTVPVRVIRPILFPLSSVNQTFPSRPAVMPMGPLPAVGTVNSITAPAGVIRPIRLPKNSVNQRLPSGPAVMLPRLLAAVGIGNSVEVTAGG